MVTRSDTRSEPRMAFNLYTSNRLEVLAERLAENTHVEPLSSPFEPEIILVQSRGMERWLALQLARRKGISANIHFPFPNAFLYDIFRLFFQMALKSHLIHPIVLDD